MRFINVARRYGIYVTVGLLLAAIAGAEILHAFSAHDDPDALLCMAPQSKVAAFREMLLLHLYSH